MFVNGCDCSIIIKTSNVEVDIPYNDETIRENITLLEENAAIEGEGNCKAIQKKCGVTGCVVTPLTISTAPLLLYLAMGSAGNPIYISETRNLHKCNLSLLPLEDTESFDLIQDRNGNCLFFEGCRVTGFELRIMREVILKLKLDISSECPARTFIYTNKLTRENKERFSSDFVTYKINGQEFKNIYGITFVCKKEGGTRTELWIKRAMVQGREIPSVIDEFCISAQLLRDNYEYRHFGNFRITIKRLVLVSDETEIVASDTVISPLRFYVSGTVTTEVFTSGETIL